MDKKQKFIEMVKKDLKKIPKSDVEELKKFISFWTEPNRSGKLIKYDYEKTWSTGRRWGLWKRNAKKWSENVEVFKPKSYTPERIPTEAERKIGREKLKALREKLKIKN